MESIGLELISYRSHSTSLQSSRAVRPLPLLSSSRFLPSDRRPDTGGMTDNILADNLETSLKMYERAQKGGIERASQNVRNVGAKILAKKAAQQEQQE